MNQVTRRLSNDIEDTLQGRISSITPDALTDWDMALTTTTTMAERAPVLIKIHHAAAHTKHANRENTPKDCSAVRLESSYLQISTPAMSSDNHTVWETTIEFQTFLCRPVYSVPLDEWNLMSSNRGSRAMRPSKARGGCVERLG